MSSHSQVKRPNSLKARGWCRPYETSESFVEHLLCIIDVTLLVCTLIMHVVGERAKLNFVVCSHVTTHVPVTGHADLVRANMGICKWGRRESF